MHRAKPLDDTIMVIKGYTQQLTGVPEVPSGTLSPYLSLPWSSWGRCPLSLTYAWHFPLLHLLSRMPSWSTKFMLYVVIILMTLFPTFHYRERALCKGHYRNTSLQRTCLEVEERVQPLYKGQNNRSQFSSTNTHTLSYPIITHLGHRFMCFHCRGLYFKMSTVWRDSPFLNSPL